MFYEFARLNWGIYSLAEVFERVEELNCFIGRVLLSRMDEMKILVLCGDAWHPPEIVRQGLGALAGAELHLIGWRMPGNGFRMSWQLIHLSSWPSLIMCLQLTKQTG